MSRDKHDSSKNRTEFQIFVNWKITAKILNVIDFSEQRLIRLARNAKRPELKARILELLDSYKKSNIAIAWQNGEPAWTQVSKG